VNDCDDQGDFWNRVAWEKSFSLPVNMDLLRAHLAPESRILDYGCGYGRTCDELTRAGYANVVGVDSSTEMIRRGRQVHPDLRLQALPASSLIGPDNTYDAVLLVAVLTGVPSDRGQRTLVAAMTQLLRPSGILHICDYLLQDDERNQRRYRESVGEFGTFGVFRLPEGAVMRHHSPDWIEALTAGLETLDMRRADAVTMNGHAARMFQYLGQRRAAGALIAGRAPL